MTANEAKKLTKKGIKNPQGPEERTYSYESLTVPYIESIEREIKQEALLGKSYLQTFYPGEEIYLILVKYFTKKGFRIGTFKTNEGYCIGDRTNLRLDW